MPIDPTSLTLAALSANQNMVNQPSPLARLDARRMEERKMRAQELETGSAALARLGEAQARMQSKATDDTQYKLYQQALQAAAPYLPTDYGDPGQTMRYYQALNTIGLQLGVDPVYMNKGNLPQMMQNIGKSDLQTIDLQRSRVQAQTDQSRAQTRAANANASLVKNLTKVGQPEARKSDTAVFDQWLSNNDPGKQGGLWNSMVTPNFSETDRARYATEMAQYKDQFWRQYSAAAAQTGTAAPREEDLNAMAVQEFIKNHPELGIANPNTGMPNLPSAPVANTQGWRPGRK